MATLASGKLSEMFEDFLKTTSDRSGEYVYRSRISQLISTSGKSPNVLKGLAAAKAKGLVTVAMTGNFGSMMQEVSRYCLCVPSNETPRIQESHILIGHIISQITEMELFAK